MQRFRLPILIPGLMAWSDGLVCLLEASLDHADPGGSLAIQRVSILVHLQHWPTCQPARTFVGWPHGIELLPGPAFAALAATLIAAVAARR